MVYLFVGEDEFSKDIKLQKIKQEFNIGQLETFNFETLYSKDLDLNTLQARLLLLPINPVSKDYPKGAGVSGGLKARQRLILIKDAPSLSSDIKQYLLTYLKQPFPHVSLILDTRRIDFRDRFFNQISGLVKMINFYQTREIDAFSLARRIMQTSSEKKSQAKDNKIKLTIRLLRHLLLQRERPEKILGAIRYQLSQERFEFNERKKKLTFLLNCDIDIKTGRLKPEFALERLLIRLCYF